MITAPVLGAELGSDTLAAASMARIVREADRIVLAPGALTLPPIKSDTDLPNNINLQIAAARAGLGQATGRWVLRVRADLIFLTRDFLDQYAELAAWPRGDAASLGQRVLISWLYMLNPYGLERLPYHLSDWFHFGLREDVAALWNVPPMTLAEALHHRMHPHPRGANARERLFNMRLADEQHLAWYPLAARRDRVPRPTRRRRRKSATSALPRTTGGESPRRAGHPRRWCCRRRSGAASRRWRLSGGRGLRAATRSRAWARPSA